MEASAVAPKMPVHVASASAASREKDNFVAHVGFRGPVEISIASSRPRIPGRATRNGQAAQSAKVSSRVAAKRASVRTTTPAILAIRHRGC